MATWSASLPALERLCLHLFCEEDNAAEAQDAHNLKVLCPLARASMPGLIALDLRISQFYSNAATGGVLELLAAAHLLTLRNLLHQFRGKWMDALAAPRWASLETLEIRVQLRCWEQESGAAAALSLALAPTLRRLALTGVWTSSIKHAQGATEWPERRSLEVNIEAPELADQLAGLALPLLERLAVGWLEGMGGSEWWLGFGACRANIPSLRVLEIKTCLCGKLRCNDVAACDDPETEQALEELHEAWPGLDVQIQRPKVLYS